MALFYNFLRAGFENTDHRPTLKVALLVSLLMSVQCFRPVFLSCFPNVSLMFLRYSELELNAANFIEVVLRFNF